MNKRILSFALLTIIILSVSVPVIADNGSTIVYIADSGTKYHRASCKHQDNSSHAVTLEAAVSLGKSPCAVCNPPRLSSTPSSSTVSVYAPTEDSGTPTFAILIALIIGFFIIRSFFRKSQSPAKQKEDSPRAQQTRTRTVASPIIEGKPGAAQKPPPSVLKPAPTKHDTLLRSYHVGDEFYCWDYYYGKVFLARILSVSQTGAEVEINGTKKYVSYVDLDRRFHSHPEDIPEYRSIKQPHAYQATAKEENIKKRRKELIAAQEASNRAQKERLQKQEDATNQALRQKEKEPVHSAALSIEKSCNNCRLRKGGQCSQVRNSPCEDFLALPDATLERDVRGKKDISSQAIYTEAKSHSRTDLPLPELEGSAVWIDIPGGGNGKIVHAEPYNLNNQQDIKIVVLFDNGAKKSLLLSICSRNRWFEILSGNIKKEGVKAYFDRLAANKAADTETAALMEASKKRHVQAQADAVLNERESAYRYLVEERDVQYLMHFTPVENIQSILDNGIIPRYHLMRDRKEVVVTDEERWDNRPDCTSFSISFPNYRMMFKKQNDFRFALLLVDPAVLLDLSIDQIYYLPDNAARMSKYGIDNFKGLDALKGLFSTPVKTNIGMKTREELDIPDCFPSNPQAEVFIKGIVKPKYIKAVVVDDPSYAKALGNKLRLPTGWDVSMVGHSVSYFKPRVDYKYWQ